MSKFSVKLPRHTVSTVLAAVMALGTAACYTPGDDPYLSCIPDALTSPMIEHYHYLSGMHFDANYDFTPASVPDTSEWPPANPPVYMNNQDPDFIALEQSFVDTGVMIYNYEAPLWAFNDPNLLAQAPILIHMHGGAWTVGSAGGKDGNQLYNRSFVVRALFSNYHVVSLRYRYFNNLTGDNAYPAGRNDLIAFLRYLQGKTSLPVANHMNPDAGICLVGLSAGGHLAVSAAKEIREYNASNPAEPLPNISCVITLGGVYDLDLANVSQTEKNMWSSGLRQQVRTDVNAYYNAAADKTAVSPMAYFDNSYATPTLVMYGEKDGVVPYLQSQNFYNLLKTIQPAGTDTDFYASINMNNPFWGDGKVSPWNTTAYDEPHLASPFGNTEFYGCNQLVANGYGASALNWLAKYLPY